MLDHNFGFVLSIIIVRTSTVPGERSENARVKPRALKRRDSIWDISSTESSDED